MAGMGIRGWAVAVGLAAFVMRFPFLFGRHTPFHRGDEEFFLWLASRIYHDNHFANHYYTPGYPAIEAALIPLPGRVEDAVVVGQHLLGVAVCVAILLVAWRYFGKVPAILAGTLAALTPILVEVEHTMSQDFVFGVILLAAAVVIAEAVRPLKPRLWLMPVAGLLFGLDAYIKPVGQLMLVAPPLALILARCGWRQVIVGSVLSVVVGLLVMLPWQIRNEHQWGHFTMSVQGGQTLFIRIYELDRTPLPTDSADGRLARRIQADLDAHPGKGRLSDDLLLALQRKRKINDDKALQIERKLALTGLRRHPGRYLVKTWPRLRFEVGHLRQFHGAGELLDQLAKTKPPWPRGVTAAVWKAARVYASIWWVVSLNLLAGLLPLFFGPSERRRAAAALTSVWLVLVGATILGEGGTNWRYAIEIAPLTWILGSAGAVLVATRLWLLATRRVGPLSRMLGDRTGYPQRN
jgi:4-amino-4-deoxy-L-arabinose transferase-like glycosyltransferase